MTKILAFATIAEGLTGLALLTVPSFVGQLLLGAELSGAAVPVARVAGIALVALAIACVPGKSLLGMLVYSSAVALYLGYLGLAGEATGILLWPAVGLHLMLSGLLAYRGGS